MYLECELQIDPRELTSMQRILLTSDGSMTRLLEAYVGEPIQAVKLAQEIITHAYLPDFFDLTEDSPILRREVLLKSAVSRMNLLHAESFIVLERLSMEIRESLFSSDTPIGVLLRRERVETFRDIIDNRKVKAHALAAFFNLDPAASLISRSYLITISQRPALWITEKFPASFGQ